MTILEVALVGIGLSMDAVAVSISNAMVCGNHKNRWLMPVFFGAFQGIMPILGFYAGSLFSRFISQYSGIVVCIILVFIGGKMIWESLRGRGEEKPPRELTIRLLCVQAIATSIDAFAVGVGFSAAGVGVYLSSGIIAAITFLCTVAAVLIGRVCGAALGSKAEILGGAILVIIGVKALF